MPSLPHNVFLIARREYLEKIRGRAFKFSTVLVPGLMILLLAGNLLTNRNLGTGKHVAIAASNPELASAIRDQILSDKAAKFTVDVMSPATEQDRAALSQKVRSKAIDGFLWIEAKHDGLPTATYISGSATDSIITGRLRTALNHALLAERLSAGGMPRAQVDALLESVPVESLRLDAKGRTGKGSGIMAFSKIILEMFLLTMPILLYGMDMARSIIEEKNSRIFEVMLSAVSSRDLLTGKLIGIGAVGLTQIAIWVAAGLLLSGSALAGAFMHGDLSLQFTWVEAILFPVYFVFGYLLYSALFAGLAATCETVQEFQMYAPLAVLPTWFSFGMLPVLLNNPNSPWSVGASLFPATSPFLMVPRIGLQPAPWWQIAVSIALLVLSLWAVMWFASRLYRIGILMYGKRATLPEIVRWLRYS